MSAQMILMNVGREKAGPENCRRASAKRVSGKKASATKKGSKKPFGEILRGDLDKIATGMKKVRKGSDLESKTGSVQLPPAAWPLLEKLAALAEKGGEVRGKGVPAELRGVLDRLIEIARERLRSRRQAGSTDKGTASLLKDLIQVKDDTEGNHTVNGRRIADLLARAKGAPQKGSARRAAFRMETTEMVGKNGTRVKQVVVEKAVEAQLESGTEGRGGSQRVEISTGWGARGLEVPVTTGEAAAAETITGAGRTTAVFNQVVKRAVFLVEQGRSTADMELISSKLGKVRVVLQVENGTVSTHFTVENAAAKAALENGVKGLAESLNGGGLDLGGFGVDVGQQQAQNRGGPRTRSGRSGLGGRIEAVTGPSATEVEATTWARGLNLIDLVA